MKRFQIILSVLMLLFAASPFHAPPILAATADPCVSAWTPVPMPVPTSGYPVLQRVSSSSPDNVWAVGYLSHEWDDPFQTLVEHWNGTAWTIVPSPNVSERSNQLNDVAVISASDAWAVGSSVGPEYVSHILLQHWDGSAWSIVDPFNGQDDTGALVSVSGIAADDVWAVGSLQYESLILHWNGTEWQSVPSPVNLSFTRVIAKAADDVWALGVDSEHKATILHWNGSTFEVVTSFQLLYGGHGIYSYSEKVSDFVVLSANAIWLVGYYSDKNQAFSRRWYWDGTTWDSTEPVVGTEKSGKSLSIAGLNTDNLWVFTRINVSISPVLSHRTATGWHDFDLTAIFPSLDRAGITAVSDDEFWIVGQTSDEPFAVHGVFTCDAPPADQPTLGSPSQGEIITEMKPTFVWQDVAGAGYYNLEITPGLHGDEPDIVEHLPHAPFSFRNEFQNQSYAWRVQACNYVGCGAWSDAVTWTQQTPPPASAPELLSPPDGASIDTVRARMNWTATLDTVSYTMELYKDSPDGTPLQTQRAPSPPLGSQRLEEAIYYWRARACNPGGCGPWSEVFQFTVDFSAPQAPVLLVPGPKQVVNMRRPIFEWESRGDGAHYRVQVRNKSKQGALVGTREADTDEHLRWNEVLPNGQYYWRVKACSVLNHCGEWSKGNKFFVEK